MNLQGKRMAKDAIREDTRDFKDTPNTPQPTLHQFYNNSQARA